ncbi:hypothetical protein BGW80DRAFT_1441577 [Lactifluus volemus]|nr:hypothetical protein BGW80DRAFT_1441577 [Lactifluus volemus]
MGANMAEGAESTSDDDNSPMRRVTKTTQTTKKKGKAKDKTTTIPKEKDKQKEENRSVALPPRPLRDRTMCSRTQTYTTVNALSPLFRGPIVASTAAARVERLVRPPLLFAPNETAPANAYASTPSLTSRVGKGWGASIGAGSVWQMVEDLGWFREAEKYQQTNLPAQVQVVCEERMCRPRVHTDLAIPDDQALIVLSAGDGNAYMPRDGGLAAAATPPVSCDFGLYGEQTNVNLETLETLKLSQFFPETRAHTITISRLRRSPRAHIPPRSVLECHVHSVPVCKYGVLHRPLVSRDRTILYVPNSHQLACKCKTNKITESYGTTRCISEKTRFNRGCFRRWLLVGVRSPVPTGLGIQKPSLTADPIYVRLPAPTLRIELEEAAFCALDWGNSKLIAAGLQMLKPSQALLSSTISAHALTLHAAVLPIGYFAHISLPSVRSPGFAYGPTVIASGGYDGLQCLRDIREVGGYVFNRTRDAINSVTYSPYLSVVVTIDYENKIKSCSVSPSTLGRGHAILVGLYGAWCIRLPSTTCGWLSRRHVLHDERPARDTAWGLRGVSIRTEGRFRMLDRLKPREMAERAEGGGSAWYPSVGVQRVTWHDGAGLARNRFPYERVETMRMEVDGMEVDEPEDNDKAPHFNLTS